LDSTRDDYQWKSYQVVRGRYASAFPRRDAPELYLVACPLRDERAQGRPGARCTRGLVCNVHKEVRTRAYRSSGVHPAFPAQWFDGARRGYGGVFGSETVRPWAETLADLPCRASRLQSALRTNDSP